MSLAVHALDHLVLNVADVEASATWYVNVLGMERRDFAPGDGRAVRTSVVFGGQKINLRPISAGQEEWFTADAMSAGSADLCFLTSQTPEQVRAHLEGCGVAVELGPVDKQGARGTLRSIYCRDPDGSLIEISSYVMEAIS